MLPLLPPPNAGLSHNRALDQILVRRNEVGQDSIQRRGVDIDLQALGVDVVPPNPRRRLVLVLDTNPLHAHVGVGPRDQPTGPSPLEGGRGRSEQVEARVQPRAAAR